MRCRAIRVQLGEARGRYDAIDHVGPGEALTGERLGGHARRDVSTATVGEVGEDPQAGAPSGDLLELGRHGLGDGVEEVGPHRVLAVDEDVHDQHGGVDDARFDLSRSAAATHEARVGFVGEGTQCDRLLEHRGLDCFGIGTPTARRA